MTLLYLAERVFNTPLLIHPDKAETILSAVILPKLRGEVVPAALVPHAKNPVATRDTGGSTIAVVPVEGTLVRRTGGMDAESGLQSYDALAATLRDVAADPAIGGIVLAVDSPGGEVPGLADTAALIRAIGKTKPVYAVADTQATSAAYWLASAAERVFVTEDSALGSIGVIAMHVDQSARDAQQGFAYTPVFAGARKADISRHAPLNDEGRAFLQAVVDRTHERFTAAVAKYRGIGQQAVKATEAAVYLGRDAIDAELADEVGGVEQAVAAMAKQLKTSSRNALGSPARQPARGPRAHATEGKPMANSQQAGGNPVENDDDGQGAVERTTERTTERPVERPDAPAPQPAPQEQPQEQPQQGARAATFDLAAVRAEAAAGATAHAVRMIRLCATAKMPALAAEFLEKGVSVEAASEQLLAKVVEAQSQAAVSTAHAAVPAPAAHAATINVGDIYARRAAAGTA